MKNWILCLILFSGFAARGAMSSAFSAVEQGNVKEVKKQMKADKALVRAQDEKGDTILLAAVAAEQEAVVQEILRFRPDLAHRNLQGKDALNLALMTGHQGIAKKLIQAGARAEPSDFLKAAAKNLAEVVVLLVKKDKGLLQAVDAEGNTALHLAAQEGSTKALRELLRSGARKEIKNKKNQTARDLALENKDAETALILK